VNPKLLLWQDNLGGGYLATSGAKSDVIFLLDGPISYKGDEISRLSLSFRDLTWDRQTTDAATVS